MIAPSPRPARSAVAAAASDVLCWAVGAYTILLAGMAHALAGTRERKQIEIPHEQARCPLVCCIAHCHA